MCIYRQRRSLLPRSITERPRFIREAPVFSFSGPDLESQVRAKAEQELHNSAIAAGILDTARKNAASTLTTLLLFSLGFEQVQVD